MILVECPEFLTSRITTVLKPYIGEAHLISSILVLTKVLNSNSYSFFGRSETYFKLTKLLSPDINISYRAFSCDIAFIDVSTIKKEFMSILLFNEWINSNTNCRNILLYDVFKEGVEILNLSDYILLKDDILLTDKV